MDKINIAEIAKGALIEQTDGEIQKILDNILDPNTDPKKKRTMTVKIAFTPIGEDRELAKIDIQTTSSVVPYNAVSTNICLGRDATGNAVAMEYMKGTVPGQVEMPDKIYKAYRNYFTTSKPDDEWQKLVELGLATTRPFEIGCGDQPTVYFISEEGFTFLSVLLGIKVVESD